MIYIQLTPPTPLSGPPYCIAHQEATAPGRFGTLTIGKKQAMNVLNALLLLPFGMAILYFSIKELLWVVDVTRSGVKAKGQIVDLIEDTMADTRQYYLVIEYSIPTGQVLRSKSKQSYINRGINQTIEIIYHKEFPEKMIVNEDKYLPVILGIAGGCVAGVVGVWGLF